MDTKKSENKAFGKSAIRRIMMSVLSMVLLVSISSSMAIPALSVTVDEETTSVSSNDTEVPESTVTEDNTTEPELTETPDEPTQDEGVDSEPENHSKKNYVLSKASRQTANAEQKQHGRLTQKVFSRFQVRAK